MTGDDDSPPSRLDIDTTVADPRWTAEFPALDSRAAAWARRAAAAAGLSGPAELSLVFADDGQVRALNHQYRGLDKPTNVLSFPLEPEPGGPAAPVLLGDVVLAFETVLREAAEQGKAPADHLAHLVVHGVLHLLGHDHQADSEAAAMERLETEILAGFGIADPYGAMGGAPTES